MGDQNKYINTYVDVTVGTVHELLNQVLQLKTEARLANDLVSERDQVISALQNEKEQIVSNLQEEQERNRVDHDKVNQANQQARTWESEVNSLKHKADNYDLLVNQFNDLKRDFLAKRNELESMQKELDEAKVKIKELQKIDRQVKREEKKSQVVIGKQVINKETTPVAKPAKVVVQRIEETDDF